jgi:hypothetical protein
MKSIIGAFVMALLIVCLAVPGLVFAGAEGASAAGSFKFELEDGATKFLEFNASEQADGQALGEMTFSDPTAIPVQDPDSGEPIKSDGVLVRAKFDCLKVSENRAVMSGEIFESNVPSTLGQRVLLVIEDNGVAEKDRLTWGIFQQPAKGWVPTDGELEEDKGASLTWTATDFERKEDQGVPSNLSKLVGCQSFPLTAFDFPEIKAAGGDLKVQR